jgi:hypothetical protein
VTIISNKGVKGPSLSVYTGYSFRIGGAIALHDAGADGMAIAALGQAMAQWCLSNLHPHGSTQGYVMDCSHE